MKKLFLILILLNAILIPVFTQNLNFIYVQLEYEMDFTLVKEKLDYLINNEFENEQFILLYANSKPMKVETKRNKIFEIENAISNTQNYTIQMPDVKDFFIKISKENKIYQIVNDYGVQKLIFNSKYNTINFYCFVGNKFFDDDFHNEVLANFIFATDLQQSKPINIYYYDTSNLTAEVIHFDSFYKNNLINVELINK